MKKLLAIVCCCALLFSGCGANSTELKPEDTTVLYAKWNDEDYEVAKHEKFNSYADENGLGGTKVKISGKITDYCTLVLEDEVMPYYKLDAGDGEWLVFLGSDKLVDLKAVVNADLEGKEVEVYGIYSGYSDKEKMPTCYVMMIPEYKFNGGKIVESKTGKEHVWMDEWVSLPIGEIPNDESAKTSGMPGIVGSQVYDIILSLEKEGVPKAKSKVSNGGFQFDTTTEDYAYSITANSKHEIASATFFTFNGSQEYLQFCATMPYDTSDSEKASKFVADNFSGEASATIGDAEFKIFQGAQGAVLEITAVGFLDYVLSES